VVSASVVVLMVLGLVALNALLAQTSFKIDDLQQRVEDLSQSVDQRSYDAARLSSPRRIWQAAHDLGLIPPEGGIQVLHVPADPASGAGSQKAVGGRP
jgi:cell division protein FtsL